MSEPAAMRDLDATQAALHPHDHAVCVYDTPEEMLAALATFVAGARERDELVVFVHSFESDDEAWAFIKRAAPEVDPETTRRIVLVSVYTAAFEGDAKRIDYEHVGRTVEAIVRRAEEQGRTGSRVFVDASRRYFEGQRAREWFDFEAWLGRRLVAKVGLVCAYRRSDVMRPDVLPDVLRTHAYRFDAPG